MELLLPAVIIVLLILASAFFSSGELGLLTLNRVRLENAARDGNRLARLQLALRSRPQRFLSTILIGNNIVNIALATYGAKLALDHLTAAGFSEQTALTLSTIVLTLVVVVFAELVPKTIATVRPERIGAFATRPLYYLDKLLTPVNILLERLLGPLLRLLTGGKMTLEQIPERAEVLTIVTMARAGGQLHAMDAQVAQEALHFSTIDLRDVMTPRVDVAGIEEGRTLGDALRLMRETGYSRLPVYRGTLDEIVGVVLIKDMVGLLATEAEQGQARDWFNEPLAGHLREVAFFPGSKSVVDTLGEIRQLRSHLAVVVDEHGGTAGIVTLEDILEELIGDIRDENDPDHSIDIVSRGKGWLIATGRARLDSIPELAHLAEEDEIESNSIGGVLMEKLGRPALVGDSVALPGGFTVSAVKVLRNRIKLVRVDLPVPGAAEDE